MVRFLPPVSHEALRVINASAGKSGSLREAPDGLGSQYQNLDQEFVYP